jgi:hypothetical protein
VKYRPPQYHIICVTDVVAIGRANRDVQSRGACRYRVLETPTGNAIDLMRRLGVFAGGKVHFEEKNGQ